MRYLTEEQARAFLRELHGKKSCVNCKHFEPFDAPESESIKHADLCVVEYQGTCTRYPPRWEPMLIDLSISESYSQPTVDYFDRCGEFFSEPATMKDLYRPELVADDEHAYGDQDEDEDDE